MPDSSFELGSSLTEDYSIADIVHKELLNVKKVKFAGVAPPHPLIKTLTMQVHTDGGDSNKLLKEAVERAQEKMSEIMSSTRKAFPDAIRPTVALNKEKVASDMTNESPSAASSA